jgi:HK97 family phage portal protein
MGLLARLAKPEQRTSVASWDGDGWVRVFGDRAKTSSGAQVTHDTALSDTAMLQGVRLIAETLATVPLQVLEADGRQREPATEHPLYNVLHDEPNEEQTAAELRSMLMSWALLMGIGYAQILRDGSGRVRELWPLTPYRVTPQRDRMTDRIWYDVMTVNGDSVRVRWEDMYVLRGFSVGGCLGLDVVNKMREAIGLGLALEQYGSRFLGSGTQLSGVVTHPRNLSAPAQERLKDSIETNHQGLDRSHRVMILEEGMTWTQTGVPPEAAQFLESRKFHVTEVARILNVQPHLLMDLERSTFSNIEHQFGEFVTVTIRPWAVRIEQAMRKKLLSRSEKDARRLIIKHRLEGLLRGDSAARAAFYSALFQMGALSPNDINELEDRNPVEGGDQRFVPLNMVPLDDTARALTQPREPDEIEEPEDRTIGEVETREAQKVERRARSIQHRTRLRRAFRRLFLDAGTRVVRRDVNAIRQLVRKHLDQLVPDAEAFFTALEEHFGRQQDYARAQIMPIIESIAQEIAVEVGEELDADPEATAAERMRFVDGYASSFAVGEVANSRGQIRALVRDTPRSEVVQVVTQRLDEWDETRPGKIAEREVVESTSALASAAYFAAGVMTLVWVAAGTESCEICRSMNGRTVSKGGAFIRAGESIADGGESIITFSRNVRHPPAHNGCVCDIGPA